MQHVNLGRTGVRVSRLCLGAMTFGLQCDEAQSGFAREAGISMATMAVGWVLADPAVTAPIIGASRPEQLADSLAAEAKPPPADLKARLDEQTRSWRAVDADR